MTTLLRSGAPGKTSAGKARRVGTPLRYTTTASFSISPVDGTRWISANTRPRPSADVPAARSWSPPGAVEAIATAVALVSSWRTSASSRLAGDQVGGVAATSTAYALGGSGG